MKKNIIIITLTFLSFFSQSQLVVDNSLTAHQLVNNILAGSGVQISNITYAGSPLSIGSFDGSNSNIGFPSGIILSSGNVEDAIGPNNISNSGENNNEAGDSDLDVTTGNLTHNAAILEFDFIPVSDTIKFNYVFASEEYMEFVNSGMNDGFGFFISGPGINGPFINNAKNLALIPGTSQFVTIDNVNEDFNGQFYFNNEYPPGQSIQYDGFTLPFQAVSQVQCGQTYHLKIVIADAGDGVWDSGVFLEAGSLSSTDVDFKFASVDGLTDFYENCTEAEFIFTRPSDQVEEVLNINIAISGTATPVDDYSAIPNSITFNIGIDSVFVPFATFVDNLPETTETVTITADVITECGDTIQIIRSITINDPIRIDSIIPQPSSSCVNDGSALSFISNENGSVSYSWTGPGSAGSQVGNTSNIQNLTGGWYYLHVEDQTCEANDSVFIGTIQAPIAALSAGTISTGAPTTVSFSNLSQNASSFEWIFGNGEDTLVSNMLDQNSFYNENISYTVTLIAFEGSCSDTAIISFDLKAESSVFEPNIFTLNGDSINEYFTLSPQNFVSFEYMIFNRWGNLMFDGNLTSPKWYGLTSNNKEAEEGVYFYKYTGLGLNGETKKGEGFFHLKK